MSFIDLPRQILAQVPSRTQLADTRALMQRVQAAAEQAWEREITWNARPTDGEPPFREEAWG
jgi:hypothetical protein